MWIMGLTFPSRAEMGNSLTSAAENSILRLIEAEQYQG
ncbi:hypothetical protein JCM19237_5946 [Photobacterium aphoticum]|uniref:Uncharacterized protein n=1 Tax=Photobacterium aphoticum TaxID=754436 RepID=A0A090QLE6_9GAMM|nr:hypothetical protein JCM19237_5946 [Photobacterium aphoticum]